MHSFAVRSQPLALAHLGVPGNPQPAEILSHSLGEVGARTLRVEIFIPQPQRSSSRARALSRNPERPGMSKVQESGWRGSQPPNVARPDHSHPRCRAILAASIRFDAPSLAIASDK
jgi:hypothetical protein